MSDTSSESKSRKRSEDRSSTRSGNTDEKTSLNDISDSEAGERIHNGGSLTEIVGKAVSEITSKEK